MTKNILFVIVLLATLFCVFSYNSYASEKSELLANLKNVPDNELAVCRVKSNDFVFFCALNRRNLYNCRVGLGTKFTLPNCKPAVKTIKKPVAKPVSKPASNPLLDLLKRNTKNY